MPPSLTRGLAGCLLVIAVLSVAGCGGSSGDAKPKLQTLTFTLTDDGCTPTKASAKTGAVLFNVVNGGTSKVTEFELKAKSGIILGEKENVVGGSSGSFTLNLQPGTYRLYCPNAKNEDGVLTVTGTAIPGRAADQERLAIAAAGYRGYVSDEADQLLTATRTFAAALRAGDLERARSLFGPTRYHYEAIEPVAESFGELDPELDAREGDVPAAQWTGFHRIEKILWNDNTTKGTRGLAAKLVADVATLDRRVKTLSFQAPQLANGAVELLNEVARSKITGEEDRYSHTDLSDFAGNVEGARKAFDLLRPTLVALGEKDLVAKIQLRFDAVSQGLDRYRRATPLGYAFYSALTPADRRTFAAQINALAEPLSTVAGKVSI